VGLLPSPPNPLPQIPSTGFLDKTPSNQTTSEKVSSQQITPIVGRKMNEKKEEEKEKGKKEGEKLERGILSEAKDSEVNSHHHSKRDRNKEVENLKTPTHRHHHNKIGKLTPTCTLDRRGCVYRKLSSVSPCISGHERNKGVSSSPSVGSNVSDIVSNAVYDNAGGSCLSTYNYSGSGCSSVSPDLNTKIYCSGNDKSESDSGFSSCSGSDWDSFSERSDMSRSDSRSESVSPLLEDK
jgi:hypothetical protein